MVYLRREKQEVRAGTLNKTRITGCEQMTGTGGTNKEHVHSTGMEIEYFSVHLEITKVYDVT